MLSSAEPLLYVMPSKALAMSSFDSMGWRTCARAHQGIVIHRPFVAIQLRDVHFPLGMILIHILVGHPGGKPFVQPDIVPPGCGDEVANPLVGEFV